MDVIVPICYGTLKNRLSRGTAETLAQAIKYQKGCPEAVIAFSSASHCFKGSDKIESQLKWKILKQSAVPENVILEALPCINSVSEAENISKLSTIGEPKRILIICSPLHSLSLEIIWRKIFPKAEIHWHYINDRLIYQSDHPIISQRNLLLLLVANWARYFTLKIFGLKITKLFRQPSCDN